MANRVHSRHADAANFLRPLQVVDSVIDEFGQIEIRNAVTSRRFEKTIAAAVHLPIANEPYKKSGNDARYSESRNQPHACGSDYEH